MTLFGVSGFPMAWARLSFIEQVTESHQLI
jgi:hypothetical protein